VNEGLHSQRKMNVLRLLKPQGTAVVVICSLLVVSIVITHVTLSLALKLLLTKENSFLEKGLDNSGILSIYVQLGRLH